MREKKYRARYEGLDLNLTAAQWSVITGIDDTTIRQRIERYGWSVEDAVTKKPHEGGCVTVNGREVKLSDLAAEHGIDVDVLRKKVKKTGDAGKAVSELKRKKEPQAPRAARRYKTARYEYDGMSKTIEEWAEYLNVSSSAIRERLKKGLPYSEVFTASYRPRRFEDRIVEFGGRKITCGQLSKELGVDPKELRDRISKRGMSVDRAIALVIKKRALTVNGESCTIGEAARRIGATRSTIYQRLKNGWSVERAISEPPRKRTAGNGQQKVLEVMYGEQV